MNVWGSLAMAALATCAILNGSVGAASACSIDGQPTLTVNGSDVVINKVVPTGPNLSVWAPFVLPYDVQMGRLETLSEIVQRIPLPVQAFKQPFRWSFGDGTKPVRGMSVRHYFSRPGVYKVTVDAYFPSHKFWYTFDAVQIHVVRG